MTIAVRPAFVMVFTGGFALLAFVLAFYALVARERRTPYITTNTIYWSSVLVLSAALAAALASVLLGQFGEASTPDDGFLARLLRPTATFLELSGQLLLLIAVLNVIWRVLILKNSHIYFRTDKFIKNLSPVRHVRSWLRSISNARSFEHDAADIPTGVLEAIEATEVFPRTGAMNTDGSQHVRSLVAAIRVEAVAQADSVAARLACAFLRAGGYVQYTTCLRSPSHFVDALKRASLAEHQDWRATAGNVLVIDWT